MTLSLRQLILPALVLTGFALLQTLALLPLAGMPFWLLLPDSLLHSLSCGLLAAPLLNLVRFSRLDALSPILRFVNYCVYVVVATAAAVGSAYLIELLVTGMDSTTLYQPLIPLRALLNAIVFTGILISVKQSKSEPDENSQEKVTIDFPPTLQDEDITTPADDITTSTDNSTSLKDTFSEEKSLTAISYTTRIALRSGTKIHVVPIGEVLYLQADGDYVQVVTPKGRFLKEQTLKSFGEQLPPESFVRVHRSILVNVEAISRIERYEKNSQQLRLKNGETVKVSQQGYKLLRESLGL
ncbi:MAG: LytTR family DNA-binding domain-containing protein [Paludibacter sp.]|jgi:hypothetical protein|nr:LytTR family DNA-binding domain-containing protein [Paludibacter sp.]